MFPIPSLGSLCHRGTGWQSRPPAERRHLWVERLEKRELLATGLGSMPGLTDTPTARFITGLYYDLLQRVPQRSEAVQWVSAADAAIGREQLAYAFLNSPECRDNLIHEAYQTLLGRAPLLSEINSWVQRLASGLTAKQLTAEFLASDEDVQKAGGDAQNWLIGLYQDALGRAPDDAGLASWNTALARGASREAMVLSVLNSLEANTRTVTQVYQALLGRDPEAFGMSVFVSALGRGLTFEQLQSLVAGSPEYYTKQDTEMAATAAGTQTTLIAADFDSRLAAAAPTLRFDFGSRNSPVAGQYVGVPLVAYTANQGYGWTSVEGMGWRDRHTANALTRDFHWGRDHTFVVDVANGTYDVTLTLGDASGALSGLNVFLEGQPVATNLSTAQGQFLTPTYRVQVTDGRLDLRLTDSTPGQNFAIAGLVVSPVLLPPPPPPPPPTGNLQVNAGPDRSASEGSAVQFQATASGGAGTLVYSWDFGDGTRITGVLNPAHTYADNGTYTAQLTMTDASGATRADTALVTVTNVAPSLHLAPSFAGTTQNALAFGATVTDPSSVDTARGFTYTWNFGDGSTGTGAAANHIYTAVGTYTATLTVTDKDGGSQSATTSVTVTQAPPPGSFIITPDDRIPNFGANPTIVSIASGNWSDVHIWSLGRLPTDGDVVSIAPSTTVSYDVASAARLQTVAIQAGGRLLFRTDVSTQLMVANFLVMDGGELQVGTAANPVAANVKASIIFLNQPLDTVADPQQYGNGLIVLGKVTMHGAAKPQTFIRLAAELRAGATTLTLEQPATGWQVGDRLVLPDSRQLNSREKWGQYQPEWEVLTIQSISPDGKTLTLTSPLRFDHLGARNADGVLEFLPHISNLSRNVVVRSESATGVRGYTFYTGRADVDMRYVQFAGLGRTTKSAIDDTTLDANGNVTHGGTNQRGRYAVYFAHLMGPVLTPADGYQFTFVGNAVSCPLNPMPFRWGLTVRDSHYGLVSDNVVYNWAGAGIVTEGGNESYNVFQHNFVVGTRGDSNPVNGDGRYGAGFWFHGFNNYVRDNVSTSNVGAFQSLVAGTGYDFYWTAGSRANVAIPLFQGADTHLAGQVQLVDMQLKPIAEFARNEAYGALASGLVIWHLGTDGYKVRPIAETVIKDFRTWHDYGSGFYAYPIQNVTFDGFVVRGDARCLNQYDGGTGWRSGDYWTGNVTIRNADIQGVYHGLASATNFSGTVTIEDSLFRVYNTAIVVSTPQTPGTRAPMLAAHWDIRNVLFNPYPGAPAPLSIQMDYADTNNADPLQKVEVFVYNYQSVQNHDFRVFFKEQDASFIVPVADPTKRFRGAPVAGLTNAQAWAQYGIAIAGEVAPSNTTRLAEIDGLVLAF